MMLEILAEAWRPVFNVYIGQNVRVTTSGLMAPTVETYEGEFYPVSSTMARVGQATVMLYTISSVVPLEQGE